MDRREANLKRDRRLRRRLLAALQSAKSGPTGEIGGRTLVDIVDSVMARDQRFEDDGHALGLLRDLADKGLADMRAGQRRKGQQPGVDFLSLRITAKGSSLVNETIPVDPDIDDDRIAEGD